MNERNSQGEKNLIKEIVKIVLYLMLVLCLTFLMVKFVGQRTQVSGSSMMPTLEDGDNLIVDKLSYRISSPQRYDIVIFPVEDTGETYYIKRIIGMPGETIYIANGKIYINDKILDDKYSEKDMEYYGIAETPILIGKDEYFVLGDNRNASSDSRDPLVGCISKDKIFGKAFMRVWPLNKLKLL